MRIQVTVCLAGVILACVSGRGQTPQPPASRQEPMPNPGAAGGIQGAASALRPNYVLGPNDQIVIRANEVEEFGDRPYRIDGDGFINLPLLGRVRAGGMSVEQFEADLVARLKSFVRVPQVIVTVVQFRAEPVFFVGAFRAPGIYPLQGKRTVVDMLSAIGGLQPYASRRIKITRRLEYGPIPLPNVEVNQESKLSSVEISMGSLQENVNPAEDIVLQPFDVVSVTRAESVYISGAVMRVGALEPMERDSLSVLQALVLSGGVTEDASLEKAVVLRPVLNTARRAEIPINLKQILAGKRPDFPLMPADTLYVPRRGGVGGIVRRQGTTLVTTTVTAIITGAVFLILR
ncbi:MAG: polysaccharide biosynthesis/export family protein [Bryobacteraceae bacterium]|nr:polysaccharide biosynthesis/export family protein [Bryobacteraceae bacterium]